MENMTSRPAIYTIYKFIIRGSNVYLLESNVIGIFSEALTANVQTVFADKPVSV